MRINHNIPAINAWRNSTVMGGKMAKALEKLSTGLRINRAADDAAGLAISEKMRAQTYGLNQAIRNALDGISLIQTAEGGLNETHALLQRMRELSVQAANDTYTTQDRAEIQTEINRLVQEVDRIAVTTEFNTKKILDGTTSALASSDKTTTEVFVRGGLRVLDQFGQKEPGGGNYKLEIVANAGVNEVQKSDIFLVKHGFTETVEIDPLSVKIDPLSGIVNFSMSDAPEGRYRVNTVEVSFLNFQMRSRADITGQYQQDTSNGYGLVGTAGITAQDPNLGVNASMVFEVVSVNSSDGTVNVNVFSHQYGKDGVYSFVEREGLTLNTGGAVNNVVIGNVTANISLAQNNRFSVGDKFSVEFIPELLDTDEQVVIRNDQGDVRQFTFSNGVWTATESDHVLRSYYLDTETGDVHSAMATMGVAGSFAQRPEVGNFEAGTPAAGVNGVTGSDLQPATNWVITENKAVNTSRSAAIEKQYTQTGQNILESVTTEGLNQSTVNASILLEVLAKDGDTLTVRVRSHQHDINLSLYRYTDQVLTYNISEDPQASGIEFSHPDPTYDPLLFTWADPSQISVGDKATIWLKGQGGNIAIDDSITIDRYYRDPINGAQDDSSRLTRIIQTGQNFAHDFTHSVFELDANTGTVHETRLMITRNAAVAGGTATFQSTDNYAVEFTMKRNFDSIANLDTRLYDIDRFWDASGNFILESPQTISLVQGDGTHTSFTLSQADTIQDVVDKLNEAIAFGLGQVNLFNPSPEDADRFASFVTTPTDGLEAVKGTFVIRSAIAGEAGRLSFVGEDATINALSLTIIQQARNNSYEVTVTEAHSNTVIADNVLLADNMLVGILHQNVDVRFASNEGVRVFWDTQTKNFRFEGGEVHTGTTFVHLADRTKVYHIGANQNQDIGIGIGNMGSRALGIYGLQVTSNELANQAIGRLDNAISMLSSERSKLGALQNRLEHTINNLGVTMENITSAESRIRDADMASEFMIYTRQQMLVESGTAMLAQANQLPQNVLQLLR